MRLRDSRVSFTTSLIRYMTGAGSVVVMRVPAFLVLVTVLV
jgi:hypothetical protein